MNMAINHFQTHPIMHSRCRCGSSRILHFHVGPPRQTPPSAPRLAGLLRCHGGHDQRRAGQLAGQETEVPGCSLAMSFGWGVAPGFDEFSTWDTLGDYVE